MESRTIISPSILSADFSCLGSELKRVSNADWVHVDVMDGHFVPNLSFGLPVMKAIKRVCSLPLDCHLMIEDPLRWAPSYAEAGAHMVTFHLEATSNPREVITAIHDAGAKAGISIKPATPVEMALELLDVADLVLVMSVEPGFGGQAFMPEVLDKVRTLRAAIDTSERSIHLEIDGGIDHSTIELAAAAGADTFVAGSAVYGSPEPGAMILALRAIAQSAR